MKIELGAADRTWSWAASSAEVAARRDLADEMVGERVRAVRYLTLDYRRDELHPELTDRGPRTIHAEAEWIEPTWLYGGFDAIDYGLELETLRRRVLAHLGSSR